MFFKQYINKRTGGVEADDWLLGHGLNHFDMTIEHLNTDKASKRVRCIKRPKDLEKELITGPKASPYIPNMIDFLLCFYA
jgi:hypothetical protein